MTAPSGIPLFRFSQVSYATSDVEHAAAVLGSVYGIERFQIDRGSEVDSPAGKIVIDVAQAFAGDLHVEIIQPAGGADALYREVLSQRGFSVRLHHFGHLTRSADEWARILDFISARRWRVVLGGNYRDLIHYAYVDTRAELGHYLEFMYQTDRGRDMFSSVPRYP